MEIKAFLKHFAGGRAVPDHTRFAPHFQGAARARSLPSAADG